MVNSPRGRAFLANQRRPLMFKAHMDNILTNQSPPLILVKNQLMFGVLEISGPVSPGMATLKTQQCYKKEQNEYFYDSKCFILVSL